MGVGPRRRTSRGDVRFEELWADHDILRNYCRRLVGDVSLADDMVQEAYAEAFVQLDGLDLRSSLLPWLATVAKRCGLRELHRRRYATPVEIVPEHPDGVAPDPAEVTVARDEVRRLGAAALTSLTPRERELLMRRVAQGMSIEQLAREDGSSPGTVRSVLFRARAKLHDLIEGGTAWVPAPVLALGDRARRRVNRLSTRATELSKLAEASYQRLGEIATTAVLAISLVATGGPPVAVLVLGNVEARGVARVLGNDARLEGAPLHMADGPPGNGAGHRAPDAASAAAPTAPGTDAGGGPAPTEESGPAAPASGTIPGPSTPPVEPPQASPPPVNNDPVESPDDVNFSQFAAGRPVDTGGSGPKDRQEVFGLGRNAGSCPSGCTVLFHSPDGGTTWEKLPAAGLREATSLLLAPGYPGDRRIYAMGPGGLALSLDGGTTFHAAPGEPHEGPAAVSPGFSDGDERILVGSAPPWVYDAEEDRTTLFTAAPMTGTVNHFAFAPDHSSSRLLFAGTFVNGPRAASRAVVHRCVADECDAGTQLSGLRDSPRVTTSSRFSTDGIVFAWVDDDVYRSSDGGKTYERIVLGTPGTVNDVADDGRGNFYAAVAEHVADTGGVAWSGDRGGTWTRRGDDTVLGQGARTVLALENGVVLAAPVIDAGSGLLCSADHGLTWTARCP